MAVKLRKGGEGRYVLTAAQVNDSFTIPAGFRVRDVVLENALPPNMYLNIQTSTLSGTAGAGTISIDGTVVYTSPGSEAAATVAARISTLGAIVGTTSGLTWYPFNNGATVVLYSVGPKTTNVAVVFAGTTITGTFAVVSGVAAGSANNIGSTILPTVDFGSYPSIKPVQNFAVTTAPTSAGVITVDGVGIYVPTGLTLAQTASLIASQNFYGASSNPWIASASGSVVTLTGVVAKQAVAGITVSVASTGMVAGTVNVVQAGQLDVVGNGTSFMSTAGAVPQAGQSIATVTSGIRSGRNYVATSNPDKITFTMAGPSTAAGTIFVCGQPLNIANSQSATQVATSIAAFANTQKGYFAYTNGSTAVTIVGGTSSQGVVYPSLALGTVAGITFTTAVSTTYTHDLPFYLNYGSAFSTGSVTGEYIGLIQPFVNAYVLTEKMN